MPRPLKPYDVVRSAVKDGVSVARFRVSQAEGRRIRDLERTKGHDAALAELVRVLRVKSPDP